MGKSFCWTISLIFLWYISLVTDSKYYSQMFQKKNKKPCDEDMLVALLAEIQAINPEAIINLSTLEKITPLCKKVSDNLEKIEELLADCEPPHQPDLYLQLIKGVEILYRKLCTDSPFRKDFEEHFNCFHKYRKEFEKCNGSPDWIENSDPQLICMEYKNLVKCYYDVAGTYCGKEAAEVMKELVVSIINSILTVKCDITGNPEDEIELAVAQIKTNTGKNKKVKKVKGKNKSNCSIAQYKLAFKLFIFTIFIFII